MDARRAVISVFLGLITIDSVVGVVTEGMDPLCVQLHCAVEAGGCMVDEQCGRALAGLQQCMMDPSLTSLISGCQPVPVDPTKALADQCTNLAVYLFKDNKPLFAITRCAQRHNCLTGVAEQDMRCPPAVSPSAFTPKRQWDRLFDDLAAANRAAASPQRYIVKRGLNWAWDCLKAQRFEFIPMSVRGKRELRYSVDVFAGNLEGPFAHLAALNGTSPAVWSIIMRYRALFWSVDLSTAGVHELDPWLVMAPGATADGSPDQRFLLVVMAVNVGPVARVRYGMPGGYVLALEDAASGAAPEPPAEVLAQWADRFGLDFSRWCTN